MSKKSTGIGIVVDRDTDETLEEWADTEGRSKRRQSAVLLRKLSELRKTHADELKRLRLIEGPALAG